MHKASTWLSDTFSLPGSNIKLPTVVFWGQSNNVLWLLEHSFVTYQDSGKRNAARSKRADTVIAPTAGHGELSNLQWQFFSCLIWFDYTSTRLPQLSENPIYGLGKLLLACTSLHTQDSPVLSKQLQLHANDSVWHSPFYRHDTTMHNRMTNVFTFDHYHWCQISGIQCGA